MTTSPFGHLMPATSFTSRGKQADRPEILLSCPPDPTPAPARPETRSRDPPANVGQPLGMVITESTVASWSITTTWCDEDLAGPAHRMALREIVRRDPHGRRSIEAVSSAHRRVITASSRDLSGPVQFGAIAAGTPSAPSAWATAITANERNVSSRHRARTNTSGGGPPQSCQSAVKDATSVLGTQQDEVRGDDSTRGPTV